MCKVSYLAGKEQDPILFKYVLILQFWQEGLLGVIHL